MLIKLADLCKKLERTLFPPMKICKICFKEIKPNTIKYMINPNLCLCSECYAKLEPKFIEFEIDKVKGVSIYQYDEQLKGLIYQFKGCYDYELKEIFLDRFKNEINLKYKNFIIVPAPSFKEDDLRRGFNHVVDSFSNLNLKIDKRIIKTEHIKQSDRNAKERGNIGDFLKLSNNKSLENKRILLVDDIYTTGSTLRACISLLRTLNPKEIKVLVLCKTPPVEHIEKSNNNKLY